MYAPRPPVFCHVSTGARELVPPFAVFVCIYLVEANVLEILTGQFQLSSRCVFLIPLRKESVTINWVFVQCPNCWRDNHQPSTIHQKRTSVIQHSNWVKSMF